MSQQQVAAVGPPSESAVEAAPAWWRRGVLADRRVRLVALAILVDALGSGLYMAGAVVFFTRYVGLSAAEVAGGLGTGGLASFLALVPLGVAVDRFGPRRMLVGLHLWRAAMLACYPLVSDFTGFVLVACALAVADRGASPALQALVGSVAGAEDRVRVMGLGRSLQNAGLAVGGLGAGVALWVASGSGYLAMVYGDCASFVLAALAVAALRAEAAAGQSGARISWGERLSVVKDRRYAAFTVLNSLLSLHVPVLTVGMPLWILSHHQLPRPAVALLLVGNTLLVVALQVRAATDVSTVSQAGRALRAGSVFLAGCCLALAAGGALGTWPAVLLLGCAVVLQALAEIYQQAGGWAVSFGLAPEDRRGVYFAFFSLGNAARNTFGPVLVTFCAVRLGSLGWLLLAAVVVTAGLASNALAARRG